MFRLNGDVVRQLEIIYGIKFKTNYRKELKERLVFFINKIYGGKSLNDLKLLKEEIVMKDFEIEHLYESFFDKYKEDLLTSFNPIWYFPNKRIYSDQEIEYITDKFIYDFLSNLEGLYIDLVKPEPLLKEDIVYSPKIYKQMENNLLTYIKQKLNTKPFRRGEFELIYSFENFLKLVEKTELNQNILNEFLKKNHFYIFDFSSKEDIFSSKEDIFSSLFNLLYLNKVLVHLRENHIKEVNV